MLWFLYISQCKTNKVNIMMIRNVEVIADKKSNNFIIYKTDSEGFHHSIFLTPEEMFALKNILDSMK